VAFCFVCMRVYIYDANIIFLLLLYYYKVLFVQK